MRLKVIQHKISTNIQNICTSLHDICSKTTIISPETT